MNEHKPEQVEMEITLPDIIEEPLQLPDGTVLSVGDTVEHSSIGVGQIIRIWTYHGDIGTCLYIDFGNEVRKEIHPSFVKKVDPSKKSP